MKNESIDQAYAFLAYRSLVQLLKKYGPVCTYLWTGPEQIKKGG